jgi:tetratricopeptide (TPR) repeat protein
VWILSICLTLFFSCISAYEVKICLVMTVQNQDTVIRKCLKSIENLIDAVCIVDLGSTDWTVYVVEEWMKDCDVPGIVLNYEKQTKTPQEYLLQSAKKFLKDKQFALPFTYFLSLDADMILYTGSSFQKTFLTQDAYLILERSSSLGSSMYDVHLMRASLPWESADPICQGWSCADIVAPSKLKNISIEAEHLSLDRDIQKLTKALKENPNNSRYLFQLAQCYKGKKYYEKAIEWYLKRVDWWEDLEEVWFSKFMIGSCYEELGMWEKALHWYMEAFQMYPDHPDPIQKITTHYRLTGKNNLAYLFAKYGSTVTRSFTQMLFDYPPLRDYQFDEEISIAAYYTRYKQDGFFAASNLLLRQHVPQWITDQNRRNIFFYSPLLQEAKFQIIDLKLPWIQEEGGERYYPISSSIIKTENGYTLLCGAVNYTQTGEKIFHTNDLTGIFRNKNFLISLDAQGNILREREVKESFVREKFPACNIEGFEECRLFQWEGDQWFTCTTNDTNPTGSCQISLCQLSPGGDVKQLIPLLGKDPHLREKNWLPFIDQNHLKMVYAYDPFVVLTPDLVSGKCILSFSDAFPLDFSQFRGSAAPIACNGGYLMLVHEIARYPDHTRAYLHRFLFLDEAFHLKKLSHPFVFLHQGIEHCIGMTLNHSGDQLILPVGIENKEIYLCSIPLDSVLGSLYPLPEYPETDPS